MKSSQKLIDYIKRAECSGVPLLEAMWDATGKVWMIGYGHSPGDVKKGDRITAFQAEELLRQDLSKFEKEAAKVVGIKTQGQFDAVVDFMYNCGVANFNSSTLKRYITGGRKTWEIQEQFLKWVNSGGKKLGGLVSRRIWEAARFAE